MYLRMIFERGDYKNGDKVRRNDSGYAFSHFAGIQRCLENAGVGQGMSA